MEIEQTIGKIKLDRIYLSLFSICFGLKTRKYHIRKKIGLNVRTVGFKNIYIVKYSHNGKEPGKHSVEFSIPVSMSCLQSVLFVLKRHAPKLKEVFFFYFYVNKTVKYKTSGILI